MQRLLAAPWPLQCVALDAKCTFDFSRRSTSAVENNRMRKLHWQTWKHAKWTDSADDI